MVAKDFVSVTRILNQFIRQFDPDYSCTVGADFEAWNNEYKIIYAIALPDACAISFQADFIRRFPQCADFNIFTLSFLHELGHLETEWDMIDDVTERIAIHHIKDQDLRDRKYYALHNERIATDWAGEYLTENHDEMKLWEEKVLAKIKKVLDKLIDE